MVLASGSSSSSSSSWCASPLDCFADPFPRENNSRGPRSASSRILAIRHTIPATTMSAQHTMTRLLRTSCLQAVAGPSTIRLQAGVGAAVLPPSQPSAKRSYGSLSRPPRIAPPVQPLPSSRVPRRFASSLPNEPSESEQREKAKDRAAVGVSRLDPDEIA